MRITEVTVTNLFNVFTHTIPMDDSRIKIIHGPNGVGKTVLFRMIHGLFNYRYRVFTEIPFDEFRVTFDTGTAVFVRKNNTQDNSSELKSSEFDEESTTSNFATAREFWIGYFDGVKESQEPYMPQKMTNALSRNIHRTIHATTPLERIDDDLWIHPEDESLLTLADIVERYDNIAERYGEKEPQWFTDYVRPVKTVFIQTQRLQQGPVKTERFPHRYFRRSDTSNTPSLTVERYSRAIVKAIQSVSTQYADQSQKIDRDFPKNLDEEWRRLNQPGNSPKYEQDKLEEKLATLEDKRKKLMNLGLLEPHEAPTLVDVDTGLAGVFSIYVDDMEAKFSVYNAISEKLQIFTEFIDGRFQHKRLKIDKSRGFVVVPLDRDGILLPNERIPTASLSSGEQHQLVLFYELLFDTEAHSLILIDEPEISLHVSWQESFLEEIERASEVGDFDVLIATHSPDIIGDRDDWMVGIGNLETT